MLKLAPFCIGGNSMKRLGGLADLLLHEDEPPELVGEPVVEGERAALSVGHAGALEGIEAQVDEDRPVDLERPPSQPFGWSMKRYL